MRINATPALRRILKGEGYLPTILTYISNLYIATILNYGLNLFLLGKDPRKTYKTVSAATNTVNKAIYNSNTLLLLSYSYIEVIRYIAFLYLLTYYPKLSRPVSRRVVATIYLYYVFS
jgi:hypothetical protein